MKCKPGLIHKRNSKPKADDKTDNKAANGTDDGK